MGVVGMPTAWTASYGSGKPVIGFMTDIDCIPRASQKPGVAYHDPIVKDAPGHGEGHNSGQAVNVVAALALKKLMEKNKTYEANQVQIQIRASEGWIQFSQGKKEEAIRLMTEAATLEDATEKHPVTPGEVIPARELLGDLLMEMGEFTKALEAYEADLKRHPGRFNGLYGAAVAANKSGNMTKAKAYFNQLRSYNDVGLARRPEISEAIAYVGSGKQ